MVSASDKDNVAAPVTFDLPLEKLNPCVNTEKIRRMIRIPVIAFHVEAFENELLEDEEEFDEKLALFSFFSNSAQGSKGVDFSAAGNDTDDEVALLSILLFSILCSPCLSGVIFTSAVLGTFFPLVLPLFDCASRVALGSSFRSSFIEYPWDAIEDVTLVDE